mgnify:CR=1 FL=1
MDNIFAIATIISIIFFIAKFLENKYLDKDNIKPIKLLVRDTLIVYFSVLCGYFIIQQINPVSQMGGAKHTPVFTDNPEF